MSGPPEVPNVSGILSLLERASDAGGILVTNEEGTVTETSHAALWELAGRAGSVLSRRSEGGVIATMLGPTIAALACLVGGWRAGLTVASLPLAPRSARGGGELQRWVRAMCEDAGADLLVVDRAMATPLTGCKEVEIVTFDDVVTLAASAAGADRPGGRFVQFSSGSTGEPKGLLLSLEAIGANAEAVSDALAPSEIRLLSGLPLSHDLGLMAALAAWVAMSANRSGPGVEVLLAPEQVLLSPARWIERLAEYRSTVTAAPPTVYQLAVRRPPRHAVDLSCLRVALVGAEPIRAGLLGAFADTFAPAGLSPDALCPAYGLAEATVGVTAVRPDEPWREVAVDQGELARGRWAPVSGSPPLHFVSNGRPLPGVQVRVAPDSPTEVGRLQVASPSLTSGCIGRGRVDIENGWLTTSDIGWVDERGEVFVVGRADDVIILAGRNLHPEQLEDSITGVGLARATSCAVVPVADGYAVVAERPARRSSDDPALCRSIRGAVVSQVGIGPRQVVLVERGWLPRTATGKIKRRSVARALEHNQVPTAYIARFDARD